MNQWKANMVIGWMLGAGVWGWATPGKPLSVAPVTPDAPAGMVQMSLGVEKSAEQGHVRYQVQWWLSGDDVSKEGRSWVPGVVVQPQKAEPVKSFFVPVLHFLPNVPAGARKMEMCGVTVGDKGSAVEVRIRLSRRDAPLYEFLPNHIMHMGVYQVAVKAEKYAGRVAGAVLKYPAVVESGAAPVLVWDASGQQAWKVSASVKLLRAAEPEDVRESLEGFLAQAKEQASPVSPWWPRLQRALNPPPVEDQRK